MSAVAEKAPRVERDRLGACFDYAGHAHTEFAEGNGQIQYITYAHTTGPFRSDIPLVKVVFGQAK